MATDQRPSFPDPATLLLRLGAGLRRGAGSERADRDPEDVDEVVPGRAGASRNTLEWLWDGLLPAERVVASALAEAGPTQSPGRARAACCTKAACASSSASCRTRPDFARLGLIETVEGGYRFRVELLRRWMAEHKPLQPRAGRPGPHRAGGREPYRAATGVISERPTGSGRRAVAQAIGLNPNHVGATNYWRTFCWPGATGRGAGVAGAAVRVPARCCPLRLVQACLPWSGCGERR